MNALIVGTNKQPILDYLPGGDFLIIDDGTLFKTHPSDVRKFDPQKHCFDPLKDMDYRKACDFVDVLDAVFPRGDGTLTKDTGLELVLEKLLERPASIAELIPEPDRKSLPGHIWAHSKTQRLMRSPVLERVFNPSLPFAFEGKIVARINRAELGDFDAYVLGNLLISRFKGTVVIPDFGFYAHRGHRSLLLQDRLIAGINSFAEVPEFKNELLLIDPKVGSHCTYDDAKTLALYAGLHPDNMREDNPYNEAIDRSMA